MLSLILYAFVLLAFPSVIATNETEEHLNGRDTFQVKVKNMGRFGSLEELIVSATQAYL